MTEGKGLDSFLVRGKRREREEFCKPQHTRGRRLGYGAREERKKKVEFLRGRGKSSDFSASNTETACTLSRGGKGRRRPMPCGEKRQLHR